MARRTNRGRASPRRRKTAIRKHSAIAALLIGALASTPAVALDNDDLAAMMGMLRRLREPVCPSMSFDPPLCQTMRLPGGRPGAVRRDHRVAFEQGYAVAGEWLSRGATAKFREAVEIFFDGKHDLWGHVKETPDAPVPGLTIRR